MKRGGAAAYSPRTASRACASGRSAWLSKSSRPAFIASRWSFRTGPGGTGRLATAEVTPGCSRASSARRPARSSSANSRRALRCRSLILAPSRMSHLTTLVVSSYMPVRGSGRAARTYGIVRALAASGPVELLHTRFGADRPDPAYESIDGLRLHPVTSSRGARRALAYARARATGVPRAVARGVSPDLAAAAERLAGGTERVVADDPLGAVARLPLAGRRPLIYSAHNLESAFRPGHDSDWGSAAGLRRFERRLL